MEPHRGAVDVRKEKQKEKGDALKEEVELGGFRNEVASWITYWLIWFLTWVILAPIAAVDWACSWTKEKLALFSRRRNQRQLPQ